MEIKKGMKINVKISGNNTNTRVGVSIEGDESDVILNRKYRVMNDGRYLYIYQDGEIELDRIKRTIEHEIKEKQPKTLRKTREIIDYIMNEVFKELDDVKTNLLEYDDVELYYRYK